MAGIVEAVAGPAAAWLCKLLAVLLLKHLITLQWSWSSMSKHCMKIVAALRSEKCRSVGGAGRPEVAQADSDRYESEGEGERYEFGQECLDRIALAIGGNTIVPARLQPALSLLQVPRPWSSAGHLHQLSIA